MADEVVTPTYQGPDRRSEVITCPCHRKHEAILKRHDAELETIRTTREEHEKDMWDDIKAKTPYKLFIVAVVLVCGAVGAVFVQGHTTSKEVTANTVRIEHLMEMNKKIQQSIEKIDDKLDEHMHLTTNREG